MVPFGVKGTSVAPKSSARVSPPFTVQGANPLAFCGLLNMVDPLSAVSYREIKMTPTIFGGHDHLGPEDNQMRLHVALLRFAWCSLGRPAGWQGWEKGPPKKTP